MRKKPTITESRTLRSVALATLFILAAATLRGYGANFIFGTGVGYSFPMSASLYGSHPAGYMTRSLKTCSIQSIGVAGGHFGLLLEGCVQNYGESWAGYGTDYGHDRFLYLGGALEYRFFGDIRRTINPYVSLGAYALFYLYLFGSGPPEYPKTGSINFTVGTRIRLVKVLYLNPRMTYLTGSSALVVQAGIDLII
jgi:hypothetical protein